MEKCKYEPVVESVQSPVCGHLTVWGVKNSQLRQRNTTPMRQHVFWDCPVAQAVRQEPLQQPGTAALQRAHLWLLEPPYPEVQKVVWWVVRLAALSAMAGGHSHLWAVTCDAAASVALAAASQLAGNEF